jgi:hypothetical protein
MESNLALLTNYNRSYFLKWQEKSGANTVE